MLSVENGECFRVVTRTDENAYRRRAQILALMVGLGAVVLLVVRPAFEAAVGFYVAEAIAAAGLGLLVLGLLRPVSTTFEATSSEIRWWRGRGKARVLSRAAIRCIDFDQGADHDMSIVYFRDSAWWDRLPDTILRHEGLYLLLTKWLRSHWSDVEIRGASQSTPNQ